MSGFNTNQKYKHEVLAKKKEPSKRAADKKKTPANSAQNSNCDDKDLDFDDKKEMAPPEAKKGGRGKNAAANDKNTKQPAAAKKGEIVVKLRISPDKKVRKIRASPFNKKSGSVIGRARLDEEGGNEASSETTEETAEIALGRGRSQRTNRTQVSYVVSDSDSEAVAADSDFDEEDGDFDED